MEKLKGNWKDYIGRYIRLDGKELYIVTSNGHCTRIRGEYKGCHLGSFDRWLLMLIGFNPENNNNNNNYEIY